MTGPPQAKYWRTPLDLDRLSVPHGNVRVVIERCKGCEFCVEYCPRDVLVMSRDFNKKGYHYPEAQMSDRCVDCDLCEMVCPEFAIFAAPAESRAAGSAAPHEEAAP
jgi:2-oxoglutarate ferredoxin oxidoreductase subunit delta